MTQTELKCLRQNSMFLAGAGSEGQNERIERAKAFKVKHKFWGVKLA